MGLVSQSIKNLKGGISQQPDILRFPNQGQEQVNGWSSESQGLQKRPPSTFIKRLSTPGAFGAAPLVHLVNRDATEQYYMVMTGSGIAIYDLKGNNYLVRGYDGYANTASPRTELRLITVADYTFVVNRRTVVRASGVGAWAGYGPLNLRGLIAVRGGQYGRTLQVIIDGLLVANYALPSGVGTNAELPAMVSAMDAQSIAVVLAGQINTNGAPYGISAVAGQGWIQVSRTTGITTIKTADGYADQLINGFIAQVQSFNKLPAQAPDGYIVEITGEATRSGDNYWSRFDGSAKVWREIEKPGIDRGMNHATMPRALVRAADGNFDWVMPNWEVRHAGDDNTNPLPSFVDGTINDVFFFRNRLGFLSGENVILSRTSRYFNFFPPSVATLSDDDPIDVAVSHNRVSILKYAVPFSEQLLLWSDQAQFVMASQGILSPKTVELNLTTEFDVQDSARPYGIGRGVYFSAPRAAYTSLKRYYAVQDVSDVKNAEDVSAHVPSYIENGVFNLHGSGTENYVTILSAGDQQKVYIYKFLFIDEKIVQQAWSYWEFGVVNRILACASIGSYMYLMVDRSEGIVMERIEFTAFTKDFVREPYRTYMDGKVEVLCSVYNEDLNRSSMSITAIWGGLPHNSTSVYTVDTQGVIEEHTAPVAGWASDPYLYLTGDRRGQWFIVGRQYTFQYEFSKFLIKQTADDGTTATEDIGRLQLRRAWLNYEKSGAFEINVNNGSSTEFVYTMSGGRLGNDLRLGEFSLGTGQFKFPVTGNAMKQRVSIFSSTPNPLNVIGGGFEGNYLRRSSGI
jgi:hypothetical protein